MSGAAGDLVAAHPFVSGFPPAAVDLVIAHAAPVVAEPGSLLFEEGDAAEAAYLLTVGHVAIEVHAPNRGPIVIETIGPGQVVGLSWAASPFRYQFDARALDHVEAVAIDTARLRAALAQQPEFGYLVLDRLAGIMLERLQATRVRLLDLYGSDAR